MKLLKMESTYNRNLEYADNTAQPAASSKPRNLKLKFSNQVIASPVFTGHLITTKPGTDGRENKPIELILVDSNTQQLITTGPEASATVKLVLLRDNDSISTTNFQQNIVVNWKNKRNLLAGVDLVNLKQGRGTTTGIWIKHDRNAVSNVRFRLGAMVVDCVDQLVAVTDPFEVKDRRNLPKGLRVLTLEDEVGRLRNVSRKRKGVIRTRLEGNGIRTVGEFLAKYSSNPQQLQEICDMKGQKWVEMVNHAKTCLDVTKAHESSDYNIEFGIDCYKPQPCENEKFIEDPSFSIQEYSVDAIMFELGLGQAGYKGGIRPWAGKSVESNRVTAKKRWMKMVIFSLSVVRFGNKVGLG